MKLKDLLYLSIAVVIGISCSKKERTPAVAEWNGYELATDIFQKQYIAYASYNPMMDNQTERIRYAQFLLERVIIAKMGEQDRLDTLREVKTDIKLKKENVLRQQYMRSIMDGRVSQPEEKEIREAFRKKNTSILLEQIFAKTAKEIDSLDHLLKTGANFEKIARESMKKYNPDQSDTTYKMGWVSYGEMDLVPEEVAFSLKEGTRSRPVQSLNGWHIFRAKKVKTPPEADVVAYKNEHESLKYDLYRRRYEEATQFYLDSVFAQIPKKINSEILSMVWKKVDVWKKSTEPQNLDIKFAIEAGQYNDSELPRTTVLATVDGSPYTVGQFLDHLQSIPTYMLYSNLQQALEFALKDSIFAKRAELSGFNSNQVVQLEERSARLNALYYAKLRATVDTLQVERLKDNYYEKWKNRYFIDSVMSTFKAYVYADSASVWKTIRAWQKSRNFKQAVEESNSHLKIVERTTKAAISEIGGKPEHFLPMEPEKMDEVFAGPYEEPEGKQILISPVSRSYIYISRKNAAEKLNQAITQNLSQITHEQLLPKSYSRDKITLNLEAIDGIVPYMVQEIQKQKK